MPVLLALAAAVAYGLSDFIGGLVSRHANAWAVALVAQAAGVVGIGVTASLVSGAPTGADWAWAVLGGFGSGLGTGFLYRGLGSGRMAVVAPISAIGAALLPVAVGVGLGERPGALTWLGIVCALPAIWLVSRSADDLGATAARGSRSDVVNGLLAGLGFGLIFVALGQVSAGAGLGPLVVVQLVSMLTLVLLAASLRQPWRPTGGRVWWALGAGVMGATATLLFLLANRSGLLTVTAVLASLYPAVTVLLAALLLREHIGRGQAVGLALAAAAVSLVAVG